MRSIKVPDLRIEITGSTEVVDFKWFVCSLLNGDERFNRTGAGIRRAMRIERALEATKGKAEMVLDEADWFELNEAAENPSAGYSITPARQLVPFIEAIAAAAPLDAPPA